MATFDGKRVSRRWKRVLTAARKDGVRFVLTSGRRTLAEQARLFRQNMVMPGVPKPGRPRTAVPSPFAPHIRVGRQAHALDVNSLDGGEQRLENWLDRHGADARNTVAGEPWHLEVSDRNLRRLSAKVKRENRRHARKAASQRKLSDNGLDLIARFEGFVPHVYNDAAGHATVGFGHLLHHGPATAADRARYGTRENPKLSRSEALVLLRRDARQAQDAVRSLVRTGVSQNEYDALVSFVFNVGAGAFKTSTLLQLLNRGRRGRAGVQFLRWNKAGGRVLLGLSRRRRAERRLFRSR